MWYGECGDSEKVPGKKYNCNYTGPPRPLLSEGYDLLTVQAFFFDILMLSSCASFCSVEKFYQSDVLWFVFACRSFVLDMITVTEASAVMSNSCAPSKGVSSCPFSSCLGMQLNCNYLIKHLTCSLDGHYYSLSEFFFDSVTHNHNVYAQVSCMFLQSDEPLL